MFTIYRMPDGSLIDIGPCKDGSPAQIFINDTWKPLGGIPAMDLAVVASKEEIARANACSESALGRSETDVKSGVTSIPHLSSERLAELERKTRPSGYEEPGDFSERMSLLALGIESIPKEEPDGEALDRGQALLAALRFAAVRHAGQRRKDAAQTPYINHPIAVAELLARVGGVTDLTLLQAALLHDTIEDVGVKPEELEERFGRAVRVLVEEVTDDKSLPKAERKHLQVEHAAHLSQAAKQIKMADKSCNIGDITPEAPAAWPLGRKLEYLAWAEKVVAGCRGANPELERHFDDVVKAKRAALGN